MTLEDKLMECVQLVGPLLSHIPIVLVSLGAHGVLYCSTAPQQEEGGGVQPRYLHYPAAASHLLPARVLSVSGAGDRLVRRHEGMNQCYILYTPCLAATTYTLYYSNSAE